MANKNRRDRQREAKRAARTKAAAHSEPSYGSGPTLEEVRQATARTQPTLGPGPTLDAPTAPSPLVPLTEETRGILAWIAKEESAIRAKLAGLNTLAQSQQDALKQTMAGMESCKLQLQMAEASRYAVAQGARSFHGLTEDFRLTPDGSLSIQG